MLYLTLSMVEDASSNSLRLESQVVHLRDSAFTEGQTAIIAMVPCCPRDETKWHTQLDIC